MRSKFLREGLRELYPITEEQEVLLPPVLEPQLGGCSCVLLVTSQRRLLVTGTRFSMMLDLTSEDVGYVAMPLFHSNAVMVGWAPSIVAGASVGPDSQSPKRAVEFKGGAAC